MLCFRNKAADTVVLFKLKTGRWEACDRISFVREASRC